eukprot:1160384-Pelagomonas_calceolata.AAC.4
MDAPLRSSFSRFWTNLSATNTSTACALTSIMNIPPVSADAEGVPHLPALPACLEVCMSECKCGRGALFPAPAAH